MFAGMVRMAPKGNLMGKGEGRPSFAKKKHHAEGCGSYEGPEWSIVGTCDQQARLACHLVHVVGWRRSSGTALNQRSTFRLPTFSSRG